MQKRWEQRQDEFLGRSGEENTAQVLRSCAERKACTERFLSEIAQSEEETAYRSELL